MGKKIFSGNFNLISTPFPVKMFEPRYGLSQRNISSLHCATHATVRGRVLVTLRRGVLVVCMTCRSYLEKLADAWVYPRYLHQASLTTDPVERMKFVITWFLAGAWRSAQQACTPGRCKSITQLQRSVRLVTKARKNQTALVHLR